MLLHFFTFCYKTPPAHLAKALQLPIVVQHCWALLFFTLLPCPVLSPTFHPAILCLP